MSTQCRAINPPILLHQEKASNHHNVAVWRENIKKSRGDNSDNKQQMILHLWARNNFRVAYYSITDGWMGVVFKIETKMEIVTMMVPLSISVVKLLYGK